MVTGQIWHSFDFPTHVFFASHYQRSWWSLWEPRWFAGFDVASYPPLPHQIAAILGWLIGNGNAVNLLTFGSVLLFPVPVYRLTERYFGREAAGRTCILAVVTPSILLAGYAFGQLPTLFALDAGLFAADALGAYLRDGRAPRYVLLLTAAGVTVAAHHATFLFLLPPLLGTVVLAEILTTRRHRQVLGRSAVAAAGLVAVAFAVILPFWAWHATEYVTQVPIDHQSRHDLLQDLVAQDLFFWAEHGVLPMALILAAPLLRRSFRQTFPWYFLSVFLGTLGLGGTTPLPRLLFGDQWAWLTYDRFSTWADVPLVMLLGAAAATWLSHAFQVTRAKASAGRAVVAEILPRADSGRARLAWQATIGLLGVSSILAAVMPALVQSEPVPVDVRPIVQFLARDGNDRWRYLTLGMGDQAAILNSLTDAETLDGEYFTARRLPILTESGVGQIDFSLLWDPTARVLREILADPRPYSIRWAFTRDRAYEDLLSRAGWQHLTTLSNSVQVWMPAAPVPPVGPAPECSGFLAIWWGIVPLATLASTIPAWWWARSSSEG